MGARFAAAPVTTPPSSSSSYPAAAPAFPFHPSLPVPSLAVAAAFWDLRGEESWPRPPTNVLLGRMPASAAVDVAGAPAEAGSVPDEASSNASPQPAGGGGGAGLPLPDVSVWARWVLGPVLLFAIPLYRKILRTEEVVEKSVEAASEAAEKVAGVVRKVAADVANDLPAGGSLRKVVVKMEEVADMVVVYAEQAEAFVHKVDEIKEEVEEEMDPIIKEAESIQNNEGK